MASSGATVAAPVYFAGDSPQDVSLYREFQRVDAGDRLRAAANLAVPRQGPDPDYGRLWPDRDPIDAMSFDGVRRRRPAPCRSPSPRCGPARRR